MKRLCLFILIICRYSFASEEEVTTTQHFFTIDGQSYPYQAICQSYTTKDKKGEKDGKIFSISYVLESTDKTRPITFIFNGGPGSSSVWLHLGAFGPKKLQLDSELVMQTAPYNIRDNSFSLLTESDLVFIDPIGTGFSKTDEVENNHFYSIDGDVSSIGDFIENYISLHGRWNSPKYLAGESYGAFRAAELAKYLQEKKGCFLDGVILISNATDLGSICPSITNVVPYSLNLPSIAMAAYYHGFVEGVDLEDVRSRAEKFANGPYIEALIKGDSISTEMEEDIRNQLEELTGLDRSALEQCNNRISTRFFQEALFKSDEKMIGRYDSRCTGFASGTTLDDPSFFNANAAITALANDYIRKDLEFNPKETPYIILSFDVNHKWKFHRKSNWESIGYPNALSSLRSAMHMNPKLKLFVASGYYDLATPYMASDFMIDHLNIPKSIRSNITKKYYEGGHMFYLEDRVHKVFAEDLREFFQK